MPLRDQFLSPLSDRSSWDLIHGQWPAMIVQRLNAILPQRFVAGPHVHLGTTVEIDVAPFENDQDTARDDDSPAWQLSQPSVAVETELLAADEYEVRVFDVNRGRRLVAAVELVSPSNKDRTETRRAFVARCEALLRQGVSVSIVDVVTSRWSNLYVELQAMIGHAYQTMRAEATATYAVTCRWIERSRKHILETWSHVLTPGQPLPILPLWLTENLRVPLELEPSYEETCRALRIS